MAWGPWELGLWGLLGAIGFGVSGKFGTCTLGFGITQSQKGAPYFGVPQRGKLLLKK